MSVVYLDQRQLKRRRRVFYLKVILAALGITAFGAGLAYVIIYSPIFQVDNYIIENNNRLANETIFSFIKPAVLNNGIADFLGEKNFLIWPEGEIDVSGTPLLMAKISKDWLNRSIKIYVKERDLFAVWCLPNGICYWLDQSGLVFEEAPETEGGLILKVYDRDQKETLLGLKVIEDRFLGNLLILLDNLKKLSLPIKTIILDRNLQELRAETADGLVLLFSFRFNPQSSLDSLNSLLKTLDLKKTDYIDLRVENRIFYKN